MDVTNKHSKETHKENGTWKNETKKHGEEAKGTACEEEEARDESGEDQ